MFEAFDSEAFATYIYLGLHDLFLDYRSGVLI